MGGWLIALGCFFLAMTWWNYRREEADALLLTPLLFQFRFRRSEHPRIFWALLLTQTVVGLGLVLAGLMQH